MPAVTFAVAGVTDTVIGAATVTVADADFVVSAADVALMVTVAGDGTVDGAVYTPAVEIIPTVELPPLTPLTLHVTAMFAVFVTAAVKVCMAPVSTVGGRRRNGHSDRDHRRRALAAVCIGRRSCSRRRRANHDIGRIRMASIISHSQSYRERARRRCDNSGRRRVGILNRIRRVTDVRPRVTHNGVTAGGGTASTGQHHILSGRYRCRHSNSRNRTQCCLQRTRRIRHTGAAGGRRAVTFHRLQIRRARRNMTGKEPSRHSRPETSWRPLSIGR